MLVFIDESGDEGTNGKGTRWLTFGGVCVPDGQLDLLDKFVEATQKILGGGRPRGIHFNDLTHPDRKGVANLLGLPSTPWTGIAVASDTTKILPASRSRLEAQLVTYEFPLALS